MLTVNSQDTLFLVFRARFELVHNFDAMFPRHVSHLEKEVRYKKTNLCKYIAIAERQNKADPHYQHSLAQLLFPLVPGIGFYAPIAPTLNWLIGRSDS